MKRISVSIPEPCHENWDAMTPDAKGRFCGSCKKTVVDFSTMSDRQLADFFKKPVGSVCGHFSNAQLNRPIDIPKKRMPWIRYFFTMVLPAFLFSLKAGAQGEVKQVRGRIAVKTQPGKKDTCEKPVVVPVVPSKFTGKVVDENGLPLHGATVQIAGKNVATLTDSNGVYNLHVSESIEKLLISYVGYETKKVRAQDATTKDIVMLPFVGTLDGEVVITVGMVAYKPAKPIPVLKPEKRDTAFSKFIVYPNPVTPGSAISIETQKIEAGNYAVHLLNSAGERVQSNNLVIEKKPARQSLVIGRVSPGAYFLRLTNKKSGKSFTEIIIVQ